VQVAINVDEFRRQRVHELVALVPREQDALAACDEIEQAELAVDGAAILTGAQGVHILDADGTEHGYLARASRVLTHLGSAENVLHLHHDGLVDGEALLSVKCARDQASAVADVVRRHGGHAIAYFGRGTLEAMSPT
jgi:hypothetical protein